MNCPIKLVPRKCDKCPFGKDGLCDYPYIGARNALSPSATLAKAEFRRRFEEIKDDIANGRITFYNPSPEWTEELLDRTAQICTLCKIQEEARWN